MFYQNYDEVHGEDRWGMVGKAGDPFREDCLLAAPCYKCHRQPLVIAERNWEATNNDDSQQYQILVPVPTAGRSMSLPSTREEKGCSVSSSTATNG